MMPTQDDHLCLSSKPCYVLCSRYGQSTFLLLNSRSIHVHTLALFIISCGNYLTNVQPLGHLVIRGEFICTSKMGLDCKTMVANISCQTASTESKEDILFLTRISEVGKKTDIPTAT